MHLEISYINNKWGADIICLLAAIRGLWSDLWVIGGDFNVCRFEEEKLNCTRRSRAMMGFSNTIQDLELIDPPLQGAQFNWSGGEAHFQA